MRRNKCRVMITENQSHKMFYVVLLHFQVNLGVLLKLVATNLCLLTNRSMNLRDVVCKAQTCFVLEASPFAGHFLWS